MTDSVIVSLVAAAGSIATAVISTISAAILMHNSKRLEETKIMILTLKQQTDGIQDKLLDVVGVSEFARGEKVGKEKAEQLQNGSPAAL